MEEVDKILRKQKRGLDQLKGKVGEDISILKSTMAGHEVRRTGIGSDYKRRKVNLLTGQKGRWELVEVKSPASQLTSRQRKTKAKWKKRYIVDRSSAPW